MAPTSQRIRYTELAPAGIATLRATEHYSNTATLLDPVLLELIRLRASHLNGCEYCVGMHTHELQKHNETPARIAAVADWQDHPDLYTHREQAALAWTEVITNIQQGHASDAAFQAAREHFSELDLVNLTLAIASINTWNRLTIAFRAQHTAKPAPSPEFGADDGGKVAED